MKQVMCSIRMICKFAVEVEMQYYQPSFHISAGSTVPIVFN